MKNKANNNNNINFDTDPRLNILRVAEMCNVQYRNVPTGNGRFEGYCPFCGESTRRTLSLTVEHGTFKNVFKCHKCGEHGTAIQMYASLKGLSNKEAFRELISEGNITDNVRIQKMVEKSKELVDNDEPKDINKVDKVYRALLSILRLNKDDYLNLRGRGLSDEFIKSKGYKSLPRYNDTFNICNKLIKMGLDLEDVPGFYKYKSNWSLVAIEGYLIPIRNIEGKIYSMQIRLNNPKTKLRYIYFSSADKTNGSKAIVGPNISMGESIKEIYITEGPLKGDISSFLTGKTFISVPGVNSGINKLLNIVKELNPLRTIVAFDMDFMSNEHVNNAYNKLILSLNEIKVYPEIRLWSEELEYRNEITNELKKTKGIDDYCLYLKQNSIVF
ncbi:MAG: CHC2 zinc finger domain-containing protein [Romboutsia sp.]|uniref:CHC2 zinc finger domain-containing protein n=1 Tax=Romboutsia sp. TaxID=1965302 RepID=UPI003F3FD101